MSLSHFGPLTWLEDEEQGTTLTAPCPVDSRGWALQSPSPLSPSPTHPLRAPGHLGSTSITADATGAKVAELRYKAWGKNRYVSGSTPTDYRYTGQKEQASIGLYYYGARWYDAYLNRFLSPDQIIPDPYNPLDWDRYQYVRSNPIRWVDPTGHNVDCAIGESNCRELVKKEAEYLERIKTDGVDSGLGQRYKGVYAPEIRYQDSIFSQIVEGLASGQSFWTLADWLKYYSDRAAAWNQPRKNFGELVDRLTDLFLSKEDFVRAFSSVFGGVPALGHWTSASWASKNGPPLPHLNITNEGLNPDYIDTLQPGSNQSHHYVGSFFLGYYIGPEAASAVNFFRDMNNSGDINLGWVGAYDGWNFLLSPDISSISSYIRFRWGSR